MTSRLRALAALLLCTAACAAPAAAQQGRGAAPDTLPPVSAFLDSAAAVRELAALPAPVLPEGIPPLFRISYDTITGEVREVTGFFRQLPEAFTLPVASILRAHARVPAPPDWRRGTYVRVVTGPDAVIDRPPLREQPPRHVNVSETTRRISRIASQYADELHRDVLLRLRFRVLDDGTVDTSSIILRTGSGNEAVNREVVAAVARMRFRPATIEDVPLGVWVEVPIGLRFQLPLPRQERSPRGRRRPRAKRARTTTI